MRSTQEVSGYSVRDKDKDIGRVSDFIVEDGPWIIRHVVVDTRKRLPGRKALVSPEWISNVSWQDAASLSFSFFVMIFITFYIVRDGERMLMRIRELSTL